MTLTRPDRLRLMFIFFAPPAAWVIQLVVGYGLVSLACISGSKSAFYGLSIAVGAVVLAAGLLSFAAWRRRGERDGDHLSASAPPQDFVALMGVLLAAFFLLLIVATLLYGIPLNPCAPLSMPLP